MEFLSKLQENKPLFFGLIAGIALLLVLAIVVPITVSAGNGSKKGDVEVSMEPIKEDIDLLTTDNLGKALEIQALLAKQDIAASRAVDGTTCKTGYCGKQSRRRYKIQNLS